MYVTPIKKETTVRHMLINPNCMEEPEDAKFRLKAAEDRKLHILIFGFSCLVIMILLVPPRRDMDMRDLATWTLAACAFTALVAFYSHAITKQADKLRRWVLYVPSGTVWQFCEEAEAMIRTLPRDRHFHARLSLFVAAKFMLGQEEKIHELEAQGDNTGAVDEFITNIKTRADEELRALRNMLPQEGETAQ